jgi:uncharacterized membrane protein
MSLAAPAWVLAIAYWLHMLATVLWIGGLAATALIVVPAARRTVSGKEYAAFLALVQKRLQAVGWFSLVVLSLTGMFQMSSSPFYEGFLAIQNTWAIAMLLKHLSIGLMVLFSGYLTWFLGPALQRNALLLAAGKALDPARQAQYERQESLLLALNVVASVLVLLLTAIARSA